MTSQPPFWFSILLLIHVLLLTFWLGGDLGTYYSSKQVRNPKWSPDQRLIALKIMAFCDMGPRLCMPLFLASGTALIVADPLGRDLAWAMIPVALFTAGWVYLVFVDHHHGQDVRGQRARRIDWWFRVLVVAGTFIAGIATIVIPEPLGVDTNPKWLGLKVLLYGGTVLCGMLIRARLKPFPSGFSMLMTQGSSPTVEDAVGGSIERAAPYVYVIWALVIIVAWLGIAKPGAELENKPSLAPAVTGPAQPGGPDGAARL